MTEQRLPEQRFLEDVDYDDAAIGEMLFNAYREQVSVVVVNVLLERGNPLLKQWQKATIERGYPLLKQVKN